MEPVKMRIRKNDQVVVIAGRDKGKRGRVLSVDPQKNRVVVEGVGMIKRHTKPNPQRNVKGGIVERESGLLEVGATVVQDPRGRDEPAGLAAEGARPDPADATRGVEQLAVEGRDVLGGRGHTQPRSRQACATRLIAIT